MKALAGRHFASDDDVIAGFLKSKQDFFYTEIKALQLRWSKYLAFDGDYVAKKKKSKIHCPF